MLFLFYNATHLVEEEPTRPREDHCEPEAEVVETQLLLRWALIALFFMFFPHTGQLTWIFADVFNESNYPGSVPAGTYGHPP